MNIKKFENIREEYNVYTDIIDTEIKKFNADKPIIKYYIAKVNDKMPFQRMCTSSLDEALDKMRLLNNQFSSDNYCVFEGKFKALTKEDVDLYFASKKYNL